MILFHISGEHPLLPVEEIKAIYEAYGKGFQIIANSEHMVVSKSDLPSGVLSRLALTRAFYPVNRIASIKNLIKDIPSYLQGSSSFSVRCSGFESDREMERLLGNSVKRATGIDVDLKSPEKTIYLFKLGRQLFFSLRKSSPPPLSPRDPNKRPFFHPLSLSPKLSRLFLNLARTREGSRILDPFCGSGSILIEAALMGLEAYGLDMDMEMVWGAIRNLSYYGLSARVSTGDATNLEEDGFCEMDAIVTDPPYARSSKTYHWSLPKLYAGFLASAYSCLREGGYLVFAVPDNPDITSTIGASIVRPISPFEMRSSFSQYVHRSLTRRIYILRKPN